MCLLLGLCSSGVNGLVGVGDMSECLAGGMHSWAYARCPTARPILPESTELVLLVSLLQGQMGLAADGEEALLWLGRAARQLAEVVGDSADGGGSGSVGSVSSSGGTAGAGRRQLPALMSAGQCRHILSQVGCGIVLLECALPPWLSNLRRPSDAMQ